MSDSGEPFLNRQFQRANPLPIFVNVVWTTVPIVVTEETMTIEMIPAIMAYSIAVAPV